jgi:hypothetical protein
MDALAVGKWELLSRWGPSQPARSDSEGAGLGFHDLSSSAHGLDNDICGPGKWSACLVPKISGSGSVRLAYGGLPWVRVLADIATTIALYIGT